MKESKFNLFYPVNSNPKKILAYNSRSNALATIDIEDFKRFKECSLSKQYNFDDEFLNKLKAGYFLIEDSVDELGATCC